MIATIVIISLALYWLGRETDWLRVRLLVGSIMADADIELDYDGSDIDYLADYESQLQEAITDAAYYAWLKEYHAPKYRYASPKENQVDPRYRWMVKEDDVRARRNGEMLYQHRGI